MQGFTNTGPNATPASPSQQKQFDLLLGRARQIMSSAGEEWLTTMEADPVQAAVAGLAPGSLVLIMSFSHAEDLDVLAACLERQRAQADLPYIGLIGSQTKWATFRHRLEARGFAATELAQVTSPIGVPGIHGKEPEVIAVAVAAQLLQVP